MRKDIIPIERIAYLIFVFREERVMLDSSATLRRNDGKFEQGSQPQSRPIPFRFHVSTYCRRGERFDISNWKIKRAGRPPSSSLCFY